MRTQDGLIYTGVPHAAPADANRTAVFAIRADVQRPTRFGVLVRIFWKNFF
jgi:hypothetical protein